MEKIRELCNILLDQINDNMHTMDSIKESLRNIISITNEGSSIKNQGDIYFGNAEGNLFEGANNFLLNKEKKNDKEILFSAKQEGNLIECEKNLSFLKKKRGKTMIGDVVLHAKKFEFKYDEEVKSALIIKKLKKNFPGENIQMIGKNVFVVACGKYKSISSYGKYIVKARKPIIRTFSFGESAKIKPDHNLLLTSIEKFLEEPTKDLCRVIANEINNEIKNVDIVQHSEYLISCLFFNYLHKIGKETDWEKMKIFSIDTKMELYEIDFRNKEKLKAFRCDLVILYDDSLFIIEYKFRYDRKELDKGSQAVCCIQKRDYINRTLLVLEKSYPDIYKKINKAHGVGIGYSTKKQEVFCEMNYITRLIKN